MRTRHIALSLSALVALYGCQSNNDKPVSFKADIAPLFSKHCLSCHAEDGAGTRKSGLRLDSYDNLMRSKVVTPGSIAKSPLVTVILPTADHAKAMPLRGEKLSKGQVEMVERWISQGAKNN